MSIKQYKFVSPGVFINEIDQSQIPREPDAIGPVIIGRAEKGPNLIPVTCESYEEFFQTFGDTSPGLGSPDAWREGAQASPTYGSYAAQAYFRNGGPVTFVKLAGINGAQGQSAGWSVDKAYGIFLGGTGGPSATAEDMLSAVIYFPNSADSSDFNVIAGETGKEIKIRIGGKDYDVDFDRNSEKFIRKVLNTDPTKTNSSVSSKTFKYWLGQTFETSLAKHVGDNTTYTISPTELHSYKSWSNEFKSPKSGWIISQAEASNKTLYNSDRTDPQWANNEFENLHLFRFCSIRGGEWEHKNIKISIEDIKPPANEFTKYGTFSVLIRQANDSDVRPKVIERYTGLTLDPTSDSFIGKQIGDRYYTWNPTTKKYDRYGSHDNQSRYVRIEMKPDVDTAGKMPYGFEGPEKFKDADVTIGETDKTLTFPTYLLRETTDISGENLSNDSSAYFGVTTYEHTGGGFNTKHAEEFGDHGYTLSPGYIGPVGSAEAEGGEVSFVFTLDDLTVGTTETVWTPGSFAAGSSTNSVSGKSESILSSNNRFTMPMHGGFDGLDITEKDPFRNEAIDSGIKNYEFASIERAIDTVSDPEVVDMNLASIPGITDRQLTKKLIDVCASRGDSLAIIDIENDYIPSTENTKPETSRLPNVTSAVAAMKDRAVNSSYGACFYPWVTIRDEAKMKSVDVPPSVAMMGVMASSAARSELWFAPAGFTRGGLSANGAAGLPVVDVKYQLSSSERDDLYENNINPIASFPNEGIVVFGQKTLQLTRSALDRINVRRLMIYVKKEISRMSSTLLFEPNVSATWSRFLASADPFLRSVQSRFGLTEYKIVLDETTTTPELIDRNIMYAKIFLKPARAIEFIALDFTITNTGASFEDL